MNENQQISSYRVNIFRALSDPIRLKIIEFLKDSERCVCEIQPVFRKSQSTISKHLDILYQSGILDRRFEGKSTFYRIRDPKIFHLLEEVDNLILDRISAMIKVAKALESSRRD
ncbi:MAG: metalloregulator ArsR/SmtB family transcription factor [Candidatus Methylarchaceae archaeon HK02M2]|nr:metalloregulator ArsR/SmtB family transcription factor [Candidatus Methylarchaceae archaeon HK02M2]